MAYESYCAACTYLSENGSYGKYYCERKGEDHGANDPICRNFCEAYSRPDSARENMYDYSASYGSSGCYLTTIMCKILNFEDDNYYLNTLRNFRDKTMKRNPKYIPLLSVYDFVGPMIAHELENDPNREEIASTFFDNYIDKAVDAIELGKEETAINIYKAMTYGLASHYGIDIDAITPVVSVESIDMENLGHGKCKCLCK